MRTILRVLLSSRQRTRWTECESLLPEAQKKQTYVTDIIVRMDNLLTGGAFQRDDLLLDNLKLPGGVPLLEQNLPRILAVRAAARGPLAALADERASYWFGLARAI